MLERREEDVWRVIVKSLEVLPKDGRSDGVEREPVRVVAPSDPSTVPHYVERLPGQVRELLNPSGLAQSFIDDLIVPLPFRSEDVLPACQSPQQHLGRRLLIPDGTTFHELFSCLRALTV